VGPSQRGVVITGYGLVSPLGLGVPAFWRGIVAGETALRRIRNFATDDLVPDVAAEVDIALGDDPDRAGAFAELAAVEALASAALGWPATEPDATGVALGSTLGGMQLFERWDAAAFAHSPAPEGLAAVPYYGPSVRLARALRCSGPVATPQLACASGTWAIALAAEWIRAGRAQMVVAGGTDLLCRFVVAGFNSLRATADVARPFDRDRRGLVLGEGAAVVVVEDAEHAARRGAPVRARILGAGAAADAVHLTAPDREGGGAARAIGAALTEAGIEPSAIDFVSAHGTGTPYNDAMEAVVFGRVFGERAVPVQSVKGAIGHTLGAAGAFDAVVSVRALETGTIPPTAGLREVGPDCAAADVVLGEPRRAQVAHVVSTSSGFAGANAALVLGRA